MRPNKFINILKKIKFFISSEKDDRETENKPIFVWPLTISSGSQTTAGAWNVCFRILSNDDYGCEAA